MTDPDDRGLLLAWRGGDNRAGEAFVERHRPAVLRSLLNEVGATAEAEALAHRTFAVAREGRVPLREDASVPAWLLDVARRVLLDNRRGEPA